MANLVKIEKGPNGWGGPLTVKVEGKRTKVVCITGGGLSPVAVKLGQLLGAEVVDGFKTGVPDDEVAVAVIDCGGTLRCGIYPKKGIPTVNLTPVGKSGPMAKFIHEDIYVSDVKENTMFLLLGEPAEAGVSSAASVGSVPLATLCTWLPPILMSPPFSTVMFFVVTLFAVTFSAVTSPAVTFVATILFAVTLL